MSRLNYISLLLSVVFVAPAIITPAILQYQKIDAKRQAKQKILAGFKDCELTLLSFTRNDSKKLKWEHANEFEYNKKMYDVVRKKLTDTHAYYWCWLDSKETESNQQLDKFIAELLETDQEQKKNNQKFISFYDFVFLKAHFYYILKKTVKKEQNFYYLNTNIYSLVIPPNTPPPKYS